MKLKTYTINEQGEVTEVPCFSRGLSSPEVQAATKGDATRKLLLMGKAALAEPTYLYVKNGAFALLSFTEDGWVGNSGVIQDRGHSPQETKCGGASKKTKEQALESCSFFYYASAEYREACAIA